MKKLILTLLMLAGAKGYSDSVSVSIENDKWDGSDNNYSNGAEIEYAFKNSRIGISQTMYTPEDIKSEEKIEDDRPYAGLLLLKYGRGTNKKDKHFYLEGGGGFLGKRSYGKESQHLFHDLINVTKPMGWDHQIEEGFVLTFGGIGKYRIIDLEYFELIPYGGFDAGMVVNQARVGVEPRLGFNIDNGDFDNHLIHPTQLYIEDFSFWFYGIYDQKFVYDNTLLGDLEEETFVLDYGIGFRVNLGRFGLDLSHVQRTEEFKGQGGEHSFAAVTIKYKF